MEVSEKVPETALVYRELLRHSPQARRPRHPTLDLAPSRLCCARGMRRRAAACVSECACARVRERGCGRGRGRGRGRVRARARACVGAAAYAAAWADRQ
eukprot:6196270-Pleurochrysis_carterae.AAC.1